MGHSSTLGTPLSNGEKSDRRNKCSRLPLIKKRQINNLVKGYLKRQTLTIKRVKMAKPTKKTSLRSRNGARNGQLSANGASLTA